MLFVLFWIVLCVFVGVFANVRRGRNGFGWFVLALFISPLLSGLLVAILEPLEGPIYITR